MAGGVRHKKNIRRSKKSNKKVKTNKQLTRDVKMLKKAPELKYVDTYTTSALVAAGITYSRAAIAQGDDYNQRIGESVTAAFFSYKLRVIKSTPSVNPSTIRFMVVWDRQANGGAPGSPLDIATITDPLIAPHDYRLKDRYKILQDRTIILNPQSGTTGQSQIYSGNFNLHGTQIKYLDSGGTIASLTSRNLFMISFASVTAVTDCTIGLGSRFWYSDS